MQIDTKFNVGDSVWAINQNNLESVKISSIKITVSSMGYSMNFEAHTQKGMGVTKKLDELYPTKQECASAWLEKQGLVVGIK